MNPVILGTEVKFAITLTAQGFDMDEDDFTLSIMKGRNVIMEFAKTDLVISDDDKYILCIDTEMLGAGTFDLAVNAKVPDSHFPDGLRTEIQRVSLMTISKL